MQSRFDGSIDAQKALDGAKAGLIAAGGDPYTVYMTKDEAKSLNDQLAGKLSGVGAEVGIKNNLLTVIAPIAGAPAQKAGVRAGDVIAKIDGQDTTGLSIDVAVGKIRGKAGTQVKLTIVRPNSDPLVIAITRADISVPSVTWSLKNGDVGYINITTFGTDTSTMMDQAATDLKAQGAKKIILDLRNDVGLLTEEYDTTQQRLVGNFPQALTHVAVVNTAFGLQGAGGSRRRAASRSRSRS